MWYKTLEADEDLCEIVELSAENYEKSFYCAIKPGELYEKKSTLEKLIS